MAEKLLKRLGKILNPPPTVSVLRLYGPIGAMGRFNRGLDDASLAPLVERAFRPSKLAAVALAINSPGGSPAQSSMIAARIRDAAEEKSVPVLAFCEDVAASGGYMLACAADEIFVEDNSIVGSIGVISASFGFPEALEKLGVERRVQTAGAHKQRLDPFQRQKPEDVAWLADLQSQIHKNFIDVVRRARGDRLSAAPPDELFSGEVWVGGSAVERGLADAVGRLKPTIKARFGDDVRVNVVTQRRSLWSMLRTSREPQVNDLGAALAAGVLDEVERRTLWARYGL